MKIFISADLEGVNGVVSPADIIPGELGYQDSRIRMTEEINTVTDVLFCEGAEEVLVCDSHEVSQNVRIDLLDERITLIKGDTRAHSMVHGIDSTYDGLILLGHHAMFGTPKAVLDHTYDPIMIRELKVNDMACGEVGISALFAAEQGVPFIMTSGDDALSKEAKALDPEVEVAVVKKAEGRYCARCLPKKESHEVLRETARKAIQGISSRKCIEVPKEIMLEVTFQQTCMADGAERVKGVKRVGPMTVTYKCQSMKEYMEMRQVIFRAAAGFYDSRF
ncbi:MAG TPA: M55 family metallopeptidase [Anaerovoracaceae bacterium]|nr:M55 family metallopeptidase [Anaerovoracaceae bacterium]